MADDLGERTEDATPKRRAEAREDGNVPRSHDLAGALVLLIGTVALWMWLLPSLEELRLMLAAMLDRDVVADPKDVNAVWTASLMAGRAAATVLVPFLGIIWIAGLLAHISQFGWLFSPKSLAPKFNKLNPISGFQRIFSISAVVKAGMDSMKVVIVLLIATFTIVQYGDEIVILPMYGLMPALGRIGWMLFDLALRILGALLLLGLIDLIFQRWKYSRDLRMSKQQVKDEMKQTEGDPEVKRRRLRMQQQIAMQRIGASVPKADVIVTNPEHFSVAIQYDADRMNAPRVIAKGADYLALRIRQIAMKHGIPIVERPPLARALYAQVKVGQEVPPAFYQAVAEILAYVYRLGQRKAG